MSGGRAPWVALVAAVAVATVAGCSHVDFHWRRPELSTRAPDAIKRLGVWAQADEQAAPGLAAALGQLAGEYAKMRRNYLVLATHEGTGDLGAACGERVEGVLWVQALTARSDRERASLTVRAELWSCRNRQLMWSVQGHRRHPHQDPHLRQLTESTEAELGSTASRWAAPGFVLLQELLAGLPDPQLTDADVEEKLELGWASEDVPQRPQPL